MFELLDFQPHHIPGATQGKYKFYNGYEISVVAGPAGCGLYGNIKEGTYEVGVIRPNGNMLEDVRGWCSEDEVASMMWLLSQL
jgi:hypothetical protein